MVLRWINITSWASQDQIEIGERAGGGQFEELDADILTQNFYDQSGGGSLVVHLLKNKNKEVRAT